MVSKLVYNLLVGLITYLYRGEITQLLSTGRTSQYPPQKQSHIPPFTGPTPGKSSTQKRRRFVGDMWCDRSQECIWHPKMLGSFQGPHSWIIEGQWWFITPQRRQSWENIKFPWSFPEDRSLLMYHFSKVDEIRILFLYGTIWLLTRNDMFYGNIMHIYGKEISTSWENIDSLSRGRFTYRSFMHARSC